MTWMTENLQLYLSEGRIFLARHTNKIILISNIFIWCLYWNPVAGRIGQIGGPDSAPGPPVVSHWHKPTCFNINVSNRRTTFYYISAAASHFDKLIWAIRTSISSQNRNTHLQSQSLVWSLFPPQTLYSL